MLRSIVLLLTIPTGFSGLAYEVTWQKYLATLLGSHSEATAAVLAIFLGGLSAGYALFGAIAKRHVARAQARGRGSRLLVIYGAVEVAIGLYALCFPALFGLVQELSYRVPHGSAGGGFAFDVGLCALLVAPPTVLMGATIPLLTQALARGLDDATRFHAWVYAFNTAGAFGGALAAGFVLVPALGLAGVMWAMSGVNVVIGGLFLLLGRNGDAPGTAAVPGEAAPVRGVSDLYAVAALVGFGMMAVQTVVIRVGGLALGSSEYVFSTVVGVFVLCIAIGSSAVSLLSSRLRPFHVWVVAWLLVALLALLYPGIGDSPYWAHRLRVNFPNQLSAFLPFYVSGFGALLLTLGPAVVCSGALLPLLFHCLRGQVGDLGAVAGRLYAWNTVGSLAGALLGGYLLLFWVDLDDVYRISLGALAAAAAWLVVRVSGRPVAFGAGLAACALAAAALLPGWEPHMLAIGLFRSRVVNPLTEVGPDAILERTSRDSKMLFYADGPSSSVAIEEAPAPSGEISRHIKNNGKSDGSTVMDYPTMSLVGIVPALLVDEARSSFVIGFGTGVTAGALGQVPSMQRILVAEISKGVIDAAPIFDVDNRAASKDPRVEIVRSDAYRALMRSDERFDVIVSEPSNPWVAGVEMLFSREFLEAARARLTPDGVYAQWYHQYETDVESVEIVLRTYAAVFESVAVWYGVGADLILLGFNDDRAEIDLGRIERRIADPAIREELERSKIASLEALLAHEIWPIGVLHALELEGQIHRLQQPILSHQAGRGFFVGALGALPFAGAGVTAHLGESRWLLGRLARRRGGDLGEEARAEAVRATCAQRMDRCVTMLARWKLDAPNSELREEVLDEAATVGARMGKLLNRQDLAQVVAMLDPNPQRSRRRIEAAAAQNMARVFYRYSHASLPLPVEPLRDAWSRCVPRAVCRDCCADGERELNERLEALGADGEHRVDGLETVEVRVQ